MQPTSGPLHGGTCQLVLEADVAIQSDDFILVLRSHLAGKWCVSKVIAALNGFCVIICFCCHLIGVKYLHLIVVNYVKVC